MMSTRRSQAPVLQQHHVQPAAVMGDLNLVRCLGRAGVPVTLLTPEVPNPASLSRYCRRVVPTPNPEDSLEDAAAALMAVPWQEDERPCLFYQGDHDLLTASRHRDQLAERYTFLLPPPDLVEDLVDKARFLELAGRLRLPVPRSRIVEPGPGAARDIEAWGVFPCIAKPAVRTHWFRSALVGTQGPQKAVRIQDRAALRALAPALETHHTPLIVQECVEGGEERVVSFHAYVRPGGEVVAAFTGRKIRTLPPTFGVSCYVEITDDERVHRLGREILDRLEFYGVLKMDFKEDARTGRLYLLEINPRFNLWHYPAAVAGANLPALVYRDLCGLDWPLSTRVQPGVRWLALHRDLHAFPAYRRRGALTVGSWLASLCHRCVYDAFAWDDPAPAITACWTQSLKLIRRVRERLGR